ncbi:MAG TPA: glutamate-5-semialdehyde dehydrogenase [Clostridiales bacterium]|nr:glutamate-5-semialdehyde dehydrogenase [Clostridiales bacterium]
MNSELLTQATACKKASAELMNITTDVKNRALEAMAQSLEDNADYIMRQNAIDMDNAKAKGITGALLDRLELNEKRIKDMAVGLRQIKDLPDPIGEVLSMWKRPNGLQIGKKRVPLGVVGIIYEARPNVTVDAIGLCLKTGNAVILRGGSEAINSNKAIVDVLTAKAYEEGIPQGSIQLIRDTSREIATQMMKLNDYIDVLIPRGGAGLIKSVVENATVPVIETGVGNCHVYIDEDCDMDMALEIVTNAKVNRPGVCNAAETLLVHKAIASKFLPPIAQRLRDHGVELRGCGETAAIIPDIIPATEDDWSAEYLDLIIAIKVVDGIQDAIDHINRYGSGHSEAIVTNSYSHSREFLDKVDAATVYVNASTRFTDGFEFGFGAEIGISTQKLHARGPMGLNELTTTKYIVLGNGQIR